MWNFILNPPTFQNDAICPHEDSDLLLEVVFSVRQPRVAVHLRWLLTQSLRRDSLRDNIE